MHQRQTRDSRNTPAGAASSPLDTFEPLDPGRVNTMDPVETIYWCRVLCCSETELNIAVAEVGEHVTELRDWLAHRL
jgi:hypothetical protein